MHRKPAQNGSDVLCCGCTFGSCAQGPAPHQVAQHKPFERLNEEVKRRVDVVGICPNEDSIIRLIGAVLFEHNDDWQSRHRYMMVEAFSQIDTARIDPPRSITTKAA